jgi:hypothetical protein
VEKIPLGVLSGHHEEEAITLPNEKSDSQINPGPFIGTNPVSTA